MEITEVTKKTGLPASTIRYYEEIGLISSIGRKGLRRVFDQSILERLSIIALGQNAGFSLEEIASMFTEQGTLIIDKASLLKKADELNKKIKQLNAIKKGLVHAANCSALTHLECRTFRRLLKIALKSQFRNRVKKHE